MKKVVLSEPGKFEIVDGEMPRIKAGNDVLVRVASVGVCGSDMHYYREGRIGEQKITYPFVIGHEFSGIVEQVGADVKHLEPGDKVAVDPALSCGECDQCLAGRRHTCRKLQFIGNPLELDGCMQEFILLPEYACFKLPESINLDDGAFIEPLTIGFQAVQYYDAGNDIGILGVGPIGLSVMLVQKAKRKDSKLFVTDKLDYRLEFASTKGADWVGNTDTNNIVAGILKERPEGLDIVYECSGDQEAVSQAIELLKPGGKLVIVGIPEHDEISFPVHTLRRKEITIHNVRRQNEKVEEAIEFVESGEIDLSGLISHRFNFTDTSIAFDLVDKYEDRVIKANIRFPIKNSS